MNALLTHGKALLKSATIWLSALIASAPDMLTFAQANFPSISGYLPHALQDPVMRFIGIAVFLARLRTLVKVPASVMPPPDPNASRP